MRIDDALIWAKTLLSKSESALLDAQILLAHVLNKEAVYLMTWPERELLAEQKEQFESLVEQRINGVPVAYLTGTREFWSLPLKVNDSTLIPRPDTEVLVETALAYCKPNAHILDLGTGTGAIILALASELPQANCIGVDFNEEAVKLAQENGLSLKMANVIFKQSNWFENVEGNFDLIVSNPPYIDENDKHLNQGDVRFEPNSALVASENGLADIRSIAEQAREYLVNNGRLMVEHGFEQGELVRQLFLQFGYQSVETVKDYAHHERITIARYNK